MTGNRNGNWNRNGHRDWVARRARTVPDAEALVEAATGRTLSYAELDRSVAAAAGRLWELGLRPGDHLGVLLGTRVAAARVVHAAARLGVVVVMLDPDRPAVDVGAQLSKADVTALACGRETERLAVEAAARASGSGTPAAPVVTVDDPGRPGVTPLVAGPDPDSDSDSEVASGFGPDHELVSDSDPDHELAFGPDPDRGRDRGGGSDHPRHRERAPRNRHWSRGPTLVTFTSGTTGDPKAVVLTPGNLLASAVGSAFRLGVLPDDRWLCDLPVHHVGGLAPFLRSVVYGTAVVVQKRDDGFDPERTVENLHEYRATGVSLVPTQLRRLLDVGRLPDSLRFVLLGGGPIPPELVERCVKRGVPVRPTYGTTETGSQIATARPGDPATHPGSVGPPLVVSEVTLVDDDGDPVPRGDVGEVVVDGPTVTPGYYGDPDGTDATFDERGYHTGDLARRDDAGRLWIEGRLDDRIQTGGENVNPGTVEDAIRSIDGVADVAVVGIDDPEWGERIGALVVPAGSKEGDDPEWGDRLDAATIRAACRDRLPDHEVPKSVAFADALPLTASGTVEREAVREAIQSDEE